MRRFSLRVAVLLAVIGAGVAVATPARAQSRTGELRWEIEGYGGWSVLATGIGDGAAVLPAPGPPIATSSPIFPSRRVPSWFFGDGALLLNQVNQQFGVAVLIQPLDAALGGSGLAVGNGLAAGARVRRALSGRFSLEFSLDILPAAADLSADLQTAVDAARASFGPAFQGLFGSGPFTDVNVEAISTGGGSASEVAATGALVWQFGSSGGLDPYATFGGGVVTGGDGPAVTVEGRYRARIIGEVPLDETDRATVRIGTETTFVGVVGAGLRRDMSERWGIRIDGRVFVGPQPTRLLIDTDPAVAQGAPADFIETFTAPAVQFSNNASTGRESSLGGPALQGFEVFADEGLRARVLITAGVFLRF